MLQDPKIAIIVHIMMNYTDAHCHIIPNGPCPDTLAGRICDATNQTEWEKFCNAPDDKTFTCIGIHPWQIETITPNWANELYDTLAKNPCLMVGEIGMDKYHADMDTQAEIFTTQLKIASELNRPAHIHCVGAWDKLLHIFKELSKSMPPLIVAHAFNDDVGLISQIADKYNVYFSYSAPQDAKSESRILQTPHTRLLTESDAYDNDTAIQKIEDVTNAIATLTDQDTAECSEQIYQNFQKVISYVRPID